MSAEHQVVLFHYPYSPPSRQVVWYLALLGVQYAECIQPNRLPRPDVEALGLQYRRIPFMAIGRDIYCDTRLMLRRIGQLFTSEQYLPQTPEHKFILRLVEKWSQTSLFGLASSLLPLSYFAFRDPEFRKDREEMTGRSFDPEKLRRGFSENRVNIREAFDVLEGTILSDGRQFILQTQAPTLADIQAVFPLHWLVLDPDMADALPSNYISRRQFPRTFAWIERFQVAIEKAKALAPKPLNLTGSEAFERIVDAPYRLEEKIDEDDPLALTANTEVHVFPIETGFNHKDRGGLVVLTADEVAVRTRTKIGDHDINIHMPRTGFRVLPTSEKL